MHLCLFISSYSIFVSVLTPSLYILLVLQLYVTNACSCCSKFNNIVAWQVVVACSNVRYVWTVKKYSFPHFSITNKNWTGSWFPFICKFSGFPVVWCFSAACEKYRQASSKNYWKKKLEKNKNYCAAAVCLVEFEYF